MSSGAQQKAEGGGFPGGCVTQRPVTRELEKLSDLLVFDLERVGSPWAPALVCHPSSLTWVMWKILSLNFNFVHHKVCLLV